MLAGGVITTGVWAGGVGVVVSTGGVTTGVSTGACTTGAGACGVRSPAVKYQADPPTTMTNAAEMPITSQVLREIRATGNAARYSNGMT